MGNHLMALLDCNSPCNGCFCHIEICTYAICRKNIGYKYLVLGLGRRGYSVLSATLGEKRVHQEGASQSHHVYSRLEGKINPCAKGRHTGLCGINRHGGKRIAIN